MNRLGRKKAVKRVLSALLSRILLVLGAVLLMALALEVFARFHGAPIQLNIRGEYKVDIFRHDPLLGYALRPDLDLYGTKVESDVRLVTDSDGRRIGASGRSQAAEHTILLLGDSFGYGLGLPYEFTLAHRLERDLDSVRVVNLSVPSYGTSQELLALERDGFDYDPDLVLLLYCPNDVRGNIATFSKHNRIPYFLFDDDDSLVLHGVPVPEERLVLRESAVESFLNRSAGYRLVRYRLSLLLGGKTRSERREDTREWRRSVPLTVGFEEGRRITLALVEGIGRITADAGVPLVVLSAITEEQVERGRRSYEVEEGIASLCSRTPNMHWIDLLDVFDGAAANEDLWLDFNGHWNERGHELAARSVIELVRKKGLLNSGRGAGEGAPPGE